MANFRRENKCQMERERERESAGEGEEGRGARGEKRRIKKNEIVK